MSKQTSILVFVIAIFAMILSGCTNLPQAPTKTPTMSAEEMMAAAQETAEALTQATQTQWAMDNPSPTPTNTDTPTPDATATPTVPLIPPTATEAPLPYYSVGNKSVTVYPVGNPSDRSYNWVPLDALYIEVCYQNAGSGIWNTSFRCAVTNGGGTTINPQEVYLGKNVGNNEWACFSFQASPNPNQSLGSRCPSFALYTDAGVVITDGYNSTCWTIH